MNTEPTAVIVKNHLPRGCLRGQRGGVSVAALWMLAVVGLLVATVAGDTVLGIRHEMLATSSVQARWLAQAGVQQAIAALEADLTADSSHDALNEIWAQDPALFRRIPCGAGYFEVEYRPDPEYMGVDVAYGVVDENRKININRSPADVLRQLPGMTEEKVAALMDWRDADEDITPGGAESQYYLAGPVPHPCPNRPLGTAAELTLIRGFSQADVRLLAPLVTTYGDGRVNINTAPAEVLKALGVRTDIVRRMLRLRLGPDGAASTDDDMVFSDLAKVVHQLTVLLKLKAEDQLLLSRRIAEGMIGVSSSHFTIHASGVIGKNPVRHQITATVHRRGAERASIVAWVER